MTELREELKVGPDEGAVEYAERVEARLERHYEETGERIHPMATLPDERPGELLERMKVLREADGIREAEKSRKRTASPDTSGTTSGSVGRGFRTRAQERDVEGAISAFEAAKKRLFRGDGSKVYGQEEHEEKLGKLTEGLRERVGAVAAEAFKDADGYDGEVLALSYTDPASQVPASDRGRLETSRAFVKEDSEALDPAALTERLKAVSAGRDKVAKVLHARYGRARLDAIRAESGRLHREGRSTGPDAARTERALGDAVDALEAALEDPKAASKRADLKEAAAESRRVARAAKIRLSEFDGTGAAARERQTVATHAAF